MNIIINITLTILFISCASKNIQVHELDHKDQIGEIISSGGTTRVRYFSLFDDEPKDQRVSQKNLRDMKN